MANRIDQETPVSEELAKAHRRAAWVVILCLLIGAWDGYDMVIHGAVTPALLDYEPWALSATEVGTMASLALAGMLVGALGSGVLSDMFGRKRLLIGSVIWFSASMALCATAPSPEVFMLLRFLGGLALGGVLPAAIALVAEFAPRHRRQFFNGVMNIGYSFGGIAASLLAVWLLADHGFRLMFWIGFLPVFVLVPVLMKWLPESADYLILRGRFEEARATCIKYGMPWPPDEVGKAVGEGKPVNPLRALCKREYIVVIVPLVATFFVGLMLTYGLNSWLPQIMRQAGYPLTSALVSLMVLSMGAIVGIMTLSVLSDRFGPRPVVCWAFGVAVLSLYILSFSPPTPVFFAALFLAGIGANGTTVVLYGYTAALFPSATRGTVLGLGMGIGRVGAILGPQVGGFVLAMGAPVEWNFYAFMIPAALGPLIILFVPRVAPSKARSKAYPGTSTPNSEAAAAGRAEEKAAR
ncbi:MFS transporter [Rhodococcus opacus]|uniref:Aromatic acid/H+ symport family MFS transporter n=1 Tax=Rhodococcus opacus TaxID=37919 RepID=A0AAX3YG53_RHOOP|nr:MULTISPECIES: aromatic acid/H+ symport family MFS transporter [Rhodococcus]MCZ4587735.1 aromatic acid/H+ symport family MFS transporter [Rhodococcus opacus]MDI9940116.1 aromatic acid/H+ symport family MFS transporter [Rhodococcus sp. IEGM 1351]WLF46884.1 aromatic acid/H+ symport family MFS transporter [Rhodococcus opacus]